jgi:hypothetical protein
MKYLLIFLPSFTLINVHAQDLTASMDKVKLVFSLDEKGTPVYAVSYNDAPVIKPSSMGFIFKNNDGFNNNFELTGSEKSSKDTTWKPVWGEVKEIRDHYNQLTVLLRQKNSNRLLNIVFRVFSDGVGFRYEFPHQSNLKYFVINDELTQFNLTGDHKTFWIPGDYDENEYAYTTSKLSEVEDWHIPLLSNNPKEINEPDEYAVQTPLMMKTGDGLYINIHEAALVNYPSMQLHVDRENHNLLCNLVPNALGDKAYLRAPAVTPWRTIIVSDKAADILASKMILNLNEPSKIQNTSWIKPMKFIGVWWEMQTGKSGWNYDDNPDSLDTNGKLIPNHHHGANTANVKHYIDFAARNGIKGLLVEGWNTGWEEWFGNWQGGHFDFVTPAPDFDVAAISQYAKQKDVSMIMHNETSGDASTYERQIDTAYRFMNKYGYTSVKTGYVGNIIPRGEHHDGQWMVNHYVYVAQKAAHYHVMIDMHEPVRPTGLYRTYPNWLACEAGRGNEWNAFSDGNAPEHETIMPFTRLMGGPMDYTPGIFKIQGYSTVPGRQVHTTLAKQLALYVTMYSPLQMAADLPENYEAHMDAFQFIKDVAVDWDDTKILAAEPGDYIAIARKEKGKDNWFVGAVTDENKREIATDLSFLDPSKKYVATIYADAANADWKLNPEAYTINQFIVDNTSHIILKMAPGGGEAISIMPAKPSQLKLQKL